MTFEKIVPPAHDCQTPQIKDYGAGTVWTCSECGKTFRLGTVRGQDRFGVWDTKKVWSSAPNGETPMSCVGVVLAVGGVLLVIAIVAAFVAISSGFFGMLFHG